METFWFFWLRFRRAYDSAYDSDFWFSLGHKSSYDPAHDSDFDSVTSENQPQEPLKPILWDREYMYIMYMYMYINVYIKA